MKPNLKVILGLILVSLVFGFLAIYSINEGMDSNSSLYLIVPSIAIVFF